MTHFLWKNKFPREFMGSARSWVTHFLLWSIVKETKQNWSAIVEWGKSKKLGSQGGVAVSSGSLEGSCTTSEWEPESPLPLLANSIRSQFFSSIRTCVWFCCSLFFSYYWLIHYYFHPQCVMGSTSYHLVLATAMLMRRTLTTVNTIDLSSPLLGT